MYGDDYENVAKQRQQQQQQRQNFYDPFTGRRRPQVPPIFSITFSLTPENYRDLVEDTGTTWLLQFYHDHSEPCKDFAPRWEALAQKLSPMVRLGRVRIDDNFGLVQRYRSFLRCRQSACEPATSFQPYRAPTPLRSQPCPRAERVRARPRQSFCSATRQPSSWRRPTATARRAPRATAAGTTRSKCTSG